METTLLVVELATPVLMDSPIHLDAIVASDLSVSQGDEAAMASLPQIFACTDDICHAGSFFFDATGLTVSVQRTGTVVGRKPIPPSVQPNPGTRGIYVTENRYKNHMNSYEATACYRAVVSISRAFSFSMIEPTSRSRRSTAAAYDLYSLAHSSPE